MPDLIHLEQQVNERLLSDPRPQLPPFLIPEIGTWRSLTWIRAPTEQIRILCDDPAESDAWRTALAGPADTVLFPIHPLLEPLCDHEACVKSGQFTVSASYRTVFFEPDGKAALRECVPEDCLTMIKLHLDEPLPGIPGDRRLTADKIRKCVQLSAAICKAINATHLRHSLTVLRERMGMIYGQRGALFRCVPRRGVLPLFALYSRDLTDKSSPPLLLGELERRRFGAHQAAACFGELIAEPLLRALFAGLDQGFALEMHGQNTLVSIGADSLINRVFFRDLEGVQFFPRWRASRGHPPLALDLDNPELQPRPATPHRWYNRNVDHDIGRTLRNCLAVLQRSGYFSRHDVAVAIRSCRATHRRVVREFHLGSIDRAGRWLPFSRAPFGTGLRRGDYFRTQFR